METKSVLWAMKISKFLQARWNASGSQVEHSAAVLFKKQKSLTWGKPDLSFWGRVNLMRTMWLCKLQGIVPENVRAPASAVWLILPWRFLTAKLLWGARALVTEPERQGPNRSGGDCLPVSPTWGGRVLASELVRNKVVPRCFSAWL